jgi:hypothetical protein
LTSTILIGLIALSLLVACRMARYHMDISNNYAKTFMLPCQSRGFWRCLIKPTVVISKPTLSVQPTPKNEMPTLTRRQIEAVIDAGLKISLNGQNLRGLDLSGLNLSEFDFSYANLDEVNLRGANLSKAILWSVQARKANLSQANISGANLGTANLSESNLRDAILRQASLLGTSLNKADLSGSDLREANLQNAILEGAIYNAETQWPAEFTPTLE